MAMLATSHAAANAAEGIAIKRGARALAPVFVAKQLGQNVRPGQAGD